MAKPVTTLVVFFLAMNLFAGMFMATGVDEMLGIEAEIGGDEEVDDLRGETGDVSTGTSLGSTLFGMYNVLAGTLGEGIFNFIFPGLAMLERTGVVPGYITKGFLAPLFSVLIAISVISFLRGYNL